METKLVSLDPDYAQKYINGSFIGHLMINMRKSAMEKAGKKMTPAEIAKAFVSLDPNLSNL